MSQLAPMSWIARVADQVGLCGSVVRVTVIRAEGSTPREIGAAMLVSAGQIEATIGGGALELEAIAHARGLIGRPSDAATWQRAWRDFALGPSLGQCCGGYVRLLFERFTAHERAALEDLAGAADGQRMLVLRPVASGVALQTAMPNGTAPGLPAAVARALHRSPWAAQLIACRKDEPDYFIEPLASPATPLFLYGAGHVGRALIHVLNGLPFRVIWVDTSAQRFPEIVPTDVTRQIAANPAMLAEAAPRGAFHLVMTYSHPLDLAICHAVLKRGDFGFLGLIGSQTKRARFQKRLAELGIAEAQLSRLICPIGVPGIEGKQPAVIAIAVAAQILQRAASEVPMP